MNVGLLESRLWEFLSVGVWGLKEGRTDGVEAEAAKRWTERRSDVLLWRQGGSCSEAITITHDGHGLTTGTSPALLLCFHRLHPTVKLTYTSIFCISYSPAIGFWQLSGSWLWILSKIWKQPFQHCHKQLGSIKTRKHCMVWLPKY